MKNLKIFIPSFLLSLILITLLYGSTLNQELKAGVPDMDVKGQLWTTLYKNVDGDHL